MSLYFKRKTYVICDPDEYWDALFDLASEPKLVRADCATFGLRAGMTTTGRHVADNRPYHILTKLNARKHVQTRIVVGLNPYDQGTAKTLVDNAADVHKNITWYTHESTHFKCWLFELPRERQVAVLGGRNLTDSSWYDLTTITTDKFLIEPARDLFELVRNTATRIAPNAPFKLKSRGITY